MRTRHMGKLENLRITTNNDNDNDDDSLALVSAMMMSGGARMILSPSWPILTIIVTAFEEVRIPKLQQFTSFIIVLQR